MQDELVQRTGEGRELLKEHLANAEETAKGFLGALKGFRRDLGLSAQSFPDNFSADFLSRADGLGVPPMQNANSYSDLGKFLLLCDEVLNGTIKLKNPKMGPDQEMRNKMLEEARLAHTNLMDVADTANRLYQAIQTAGFEFDVFNTKNLEVGHSDMNVLFDRDAVYVSAATARALGERAVRLDIDLVEAIQSLETGEKKIRI